MGSFEIRPRSFSDKLERAAVAVEHAAWRDLGFLNYTKAHREFYDDLLERYADLQLCLVDLDTEFPVALANCVPVACNADKALPPEGWDWLVETAALDRKAPANILGALAISVPEVHRGKGYARHMLRALLQLSERLGLGGVITPVRPTAKWQHPFAPIDEYIGWRDEAGRVFDPWIRSHVQEGGRIVSACGRSMVIEEHVAFWETWAGRRLAQSGMHLIKGGLAPIEVDLERQIGRYEEPNVWVSNRH